MFGISSDFIVYDEDSYDPEKNISVDPDVILKESPILPDILEVK